MRANHKIKRRLDMANVSYHFVWQVASGEWQMTNGKWQVASGKWLCASISSWFILQVASGKWQIACMYTRMYINICLYVKYMHVSGHAPITNIGRATPPHHHHHPRLSVLVCTHVCKYAMYTHTKVSKSSTSNGRTPPPPPSPPVYNTTKYARNEPYR